MRLFFKLGHKLLSTFKRCHQGFGFISSVDIPLSSSGNDDSIASLHCAIRTFVLNPFSPGKIGLWMVRVIVVG